jgi:hypothetical protein
MLTKHQMAALVIVSLSTKTKLECFIANGTNFFQIIFDYRRLKVTNVKFRL